MGLFSCLLKHILLLTPSTEAAFIVVLIGFDQWTDPEVHKMSINNEKCTSQLHRAVHDVLKQS